MFDSHFPDLQLLTPALAVLTAMITPAVLMLAAGTLIGSTSSRLSRVVDRVRTLSETFEQIERAEKQPYAVELRAHIFDQLDKLTSRARLLQFSMTALYLSVSSYVATSVAIGLLAFITAGPYSAHVPVVLALAGMAFLFVGSVLLIFEARLALYAVHQEMGFIWKRGQRLAPSELAKHQRPVVLASSDRPPS